MIHQRNLDRSPSKRNLTTHLVFSGLLHFALRLTCILVAIIFAPSAFGDAPVPTKTSRTNNNSPRKIATNLQGFGIPFAIDKADNSFIEVQLYLSTDQGKNWQFYDRQSTDKKEFPFQADRDGEYWFALKTLNRNRQLVPPGITLPELIILVDTIKPELSFQIESDAAGRVACRWQATDAHLDLDSFQIFYQPADSPENVWSKVPIKLDGKSPNGKYADQLAWWPETTSRNLNVRLTIADTAGNQVALDRQVTVAQTPWRHRREATARPMLPQTNAPSPGVPSPAQNPQPYGFESKSPEAFPPAEANAPDHVASRQPSAQRDAANPPVCENGICQVPEKQSPPLAAKQGLRFANSGGNVIGPSQFSWIGSRPEYAEPPMPHGYVPPKIAKKVDQNRPKVQSKNAVAWSSEPERWSAQNQSNSSTTLRPDPALAPKPLLKTSIAVDEVPSFPKKNPPKELGDEATSPSAAATNNPTSPAAEEINNWSSEPYQPAGVDDLPEQSSSKDHRKTLGNSAESTPIQTPAAPVAAQTQPPKRLARLPNHHVASNDNQAGDSNSDDSKTPTSVVENFAQPDIDDAALQMIGSKRFRLDYGIDAIDPSGVAKVDLWMTRDGGNSWKSWGTDPDNTTPFPVEVEEEGRYGFRIVVHSKDGLTGRGPSSGDAADIWVHVDTQSPLAQIVSVPYGRGDEAGRLVINYRVTDPYLVLRPITLAYSRNPSGPWTPIAEGLRNEGRYVWKPTSDVSDRIFLRLEARDRAGNLGVHQLSQAIDVSGLIPRGTIHGVTPVGNAVK